MFKKKWVIRVIIAIIMIIILFFSSNEIIRQIKSDSNNDNNILNEYSDSFLDLYNLYYVLESKKLINDLSNDELTNVKKEIENYPIELVIERGNLYDLWLYVQIHKFLEIKIPEKKEILDYLESLKTNEGFYLTYPGENEDGLSSHLLSTKMSLEIMNEIKEKIDYEQINNWIKENYEEDLSKLENDPISYVGAIYLIKFIQELTKQSNSKYIFDTDELGQHLEKATGLLLMSEDNIMKYDIILEFNSLDNENSIPINEKEVENYLLSIKHKSGGFPLWGLNDEEPDILTTYIALKLQKKLYLNIPISEVDKHFLDQTLEYIFE